MNDLLDFSKIEAGRLAIEPVPFDLMTAVEDVAQILTSKSQEKGLVLKVHYPAEVPRFLVGDAGRIRQVLTNLVDNSIKFTHEGQVSIEITCKEKTKDTAKIKLIVSDTGIGIPADKLDQIFEKFTQVETSFTRRYGGTGLGLAISKQLVELMGGTVGVKSNPGSGSTFWFNLTLPLQPEVSRKTQVEFVSTPSYKKREIAHVLVVEDNDVNQEVAATILKKLGCVVDVAGNGIQAIDMAKKISYDIIFMDCSMPGMDGFEATKIIRDRESKKGKHTKIVALTAHSLEEDRERCLGVGMDDYVSKPVTMNEFRSILDKLDTRADFSTS
jgi:CheY-like chemotaxis protein